MARIADLALGRADPHCHASIAHAGISRLGVAVAPLPLDPVAQLRVIRPYNIEGAGVARFEERNTDAFVAASVLAEQDSIIPGPTCRAGLAGCDLAPEGSETGRGSDIERRQDAGRPAGG